MMQTEINLMQDWIANHVQDAVLYKATTLLSQADDDIHRVDKALEDICNMISLVEKESLRENYITRVAKANKQKPAWIKKRVKELLDDRELANAVLEAEEVVVIEEPAIINTKINPIKHWIEDHVLDAVIFKANLLLKTATGDVHMIDTALQDIGYMISLIDNEFLRESYIERIAKQNKQKPAWIKNRVEDCLDEREELAERKNKEDSIVPSWIDKEKFFTLGFDSKTDGPQHTGIYFHTGEKGAKQMTNFVVKPLIHVYSKDENQNRRLTEVNNGFSKTVLELPSKAFTSVDQFESILMNEGVYFLMDGFAKSHLNKLKSVLLRQYPKCFELKTLGWQPEGFWAFSNQIYKETLMPFNEYGYTEVDGVNYLSMAASSIQDVRAEDDFYKNDRFLSWSQPPMDFSSWAKLFVGAYGKNGWFGTMFVFLSLFRDIVYGLNSSCPHLYAYGPVGSGKSVFAESISNLFFNQMPFFNLNQGTDFAFFSRMERFRNCPVGFNEFDEHAIKDEWFRAIKGGYDGEGREKGSMTKKKKTETQEIWCTFILIGQFLSTKDDASVLTRSIPTQISETSRTAEQIECYNRLKSYEKTGLGGILVELLQHRGRMEQKYAETYAREFKKLTASFEKDGVKAKTRIQNNFCTMLTMRALLDGLIVFPFSYDEFFLHCKKEIMKLSYLIKESDSLAAFWKSIEFMFDQDMIEDGWDFKIEVKDAVPLMISRTDVGADGKNTRERRFEEPKKLMFIRMTTIHPLYMNATRQQTGKTGLNQETIVTYMKDQECFLGTIKSTSFRSKKGATTVSNAYVFDYDLMNLNLEREMAPVGIEKTIKGEVRYKNAEIIDVMGEGKLKWTMEIDQSYNKEGFTVKDVVSVTCFSKKLEDEKRLTVGTALKVSGMYHERIVGDKKRGEMMVHDIDFISALSAPDPEVKEELNLMN